MERLTNMVAMLATRPALEQMLRRAGHSLVNTRSGAADEHRWPAEEQA